jgi:hypothetical protein
MFVKRVQSQKILILSTVVCLVVGISCVSKKKYKARENELIQQRKISQTYRLSIDSLQLEIKTLNDSLHLMDSLLNETKMKSKKGTSKGTKK